MKCKWMFYVVLCIVSFFAVPALAAQESTVPLEHANINLHDKASLQRGARMFMNYCAGCHSLKYLRYTQMAEGIGLVDEKGQIYQDLLRDNLIFTDAKPFEPIKIAMQPKQAAQWFGVQPPDLTLSARVHGADWLYTYLISFYQDPKRPFGSNNLVYPETAMPNVLVNLQGILSPVYTTKTVTIEGEKKQVEEVDHLALVKSGALSEHQFHSQVNDLVNFLVFASEPVKLKRESIGIFVMIFMIILTTIAYLLKREYWKDIKKE
ncbi:MAG: cytochrome c1 [Pseudomonadota bacterium]